MANQRQQLLEYLKEYGSITMGEAFYALGIGRLSERIRELEARGHVFDKVQHKFICRTGNRGHCIKYILKDAVQPQ